MVLTSLLAIFQLYRGVSFIGGAIRSIVMTNSEINFVLFHLNISVYYGYLYNNIHDFYNHVFLEK